MSAPDPDDAGPPVHVVVVAHDTPGLLTGALAALAPDVRAGRATVAVVETGAGPGLDPGTDPHPWAARARTADNVGFGAAARLGAARRPTARWVLVLNADAHPRPGALAALLAAGEAHAGAGVLAPRLVGRDGRDEHAVHPFPSVRLALGLATGALTGSPGRAAAWFVGRVRPVRAEPVPWVHGAALLVRGRAWRALGGFAPDLWMYAEDLDLCWRAARAGWSTRLVPEAVVHHHGAASTAARWGDDRAARQIGATHRWSARRRGRARTAAVAALGVAGTLRRTPAARAWRRAHRVGSWTWMRGTTSGVPPRPDGAVRDGP